MTLSCFDLGERMLSVDEARGALCDLVTDALPAETSALAELHGRVLARDVMSPMDVPRYTNAAMDGIALAWPDNVEDAIRWERVGQVRAGTRHDTPLLSGQCLGITTGAPLPPGSDTVIMQEQLEEVGENRVIVDRPDRVRRGQNVRLAGEDIAAGTLVLPAGTRLSAAELGVLASLGMAEALVRRRPRVAIFSTGDEVTAPGTRLPTANIFDTNRFTLRGLIAEHGGEVIDMGIIPDDLASLAEALAEASDSADLVITSGGVSVGEADFTRAALAQIGELGFWRIAMRPGRPLACGRLGSRGTPFLGLPGNPVAVMVTFLQFVVPLLATMQGRDNVKPCRLTALADHALTCRTGRVDFIRGLYHSDANGTLRVCSTGAQGSGILSSMVKANCLIEVGEDREGVRAGESVTIQPLFRFP
jgi:molybdopterin molybdotransferase